MKRELTLNWTIEYFELSADGLLLLVVDEQNCLSFYENQNDFRFINRVELPPSDVADLVLGPTGEAVYVVHEGGRISRILNATTSEDFRSFYLSAADEAYLTDDLELLALRRNSRVYLHRSRGNGYSEIFSLDGDLFALSFN